MSAFTDAARTAVEASWSAGRVYAPGKVPQKPTTPYVVMYSDAGRDDTDMLDGSAGTDANRLMPMAVGATEDEVDRAVAAIKRALRGKWLDPDGFAPALVGMESSGGIVRDPDGGVLLSQTLFLTLHATEETA